MEDTSAVKMAVHFYVILLATSVFAMQSRDGRGVLANRKDVLTVELPEHFHWIYVGSRSVELGWDVDRLAHLNADEIKLTANYYDGGHAYRYVAVPFTYGKLTLDGLTPNTTYLMVLEVLRKTELLLSDVTLLTTKSGGGSLGLTLITAISGLLLLTWQ